MYDRILVPTDGSECAAGALEHAIDVASQYGAELHVLSVIDAREVSHSAPAISPEEVDKALRERAESIVDDAAERAEDAGVAVVTAIESGVPDDVIVEYAAENGCDLVVMGTHGRTGLERYLLGSVTERTVRRSEVPVLTVRDAE